MTFQGLLEASFLQFAGIGPARERALWQMGVRDLRAVASPSRTLPAWAPSPAMAEEALAAIESEDVAWWAAALPPTARWRIIAQWSEDALFADIETTGLSRFYHEITLVGWSFRDRYHYELGSEGSEELSHAADGAMLVTFNGSLFDLPFLTQTLGRPLKPALHIDLRFLARRVGLGGTQRESERLVKFQRPSDLDRLDGGHAPTLWREYLRGNSAAIDRLIRYNREDIDGMRSILDQVLDLLVTELNPPRTPARRPLPDYDRAPAPPAATKPLVTFEVLAQSTRRAMPGAVIGVDLASTRASGLACLGDGRIETSLVTTNEQIVAWIMSRQPSLVSIDAPLGLPTDGTIMRECERELRRRGVNVYPCLINSMRDLTQRGTELAGRLRRAGIDVIESFPGAMQDVLQIGRKQHGVAGLAQGLREYGITDVDTATMSHDELDAVSSAVVGQFYLAGAIELLGKPDEGLLAVPSIFFTHPSRIPVAPPDVCVLSGRSAAGKTTLARVMSERGWHVVGTSKLLALHIHAAKGIEPTRSDLTRAGMLVHEQYGQEWLWNLISANIIDQRSLGKPIVIDGIRFLDDVKFVRNAFGRATIHAHLSADEQTVRERRRELKGVEFWSSVSSVVNGEPSLAGHADLILDSTEATETLAHRVESYLGDRRTKVPTCL